MKLKDSISSIAWDAGYKRAIEDCMEIIYNCKSQAINLYEAKYYKLILKEIKQQLRELDNDRR